MALTERLATLKDLARVKSKAELIGGRIVHLMPTGDVPSRVAARIFQSLDAYAEATGSGVAYTDNAGFTVGELSSGRQSFSPDAAYHLGPFPVNRMRFLPGAPVFAVEVRSEDDYGPKAERELAAKRSDYFEAGTRVVWDVDPIAECVRSYRSDAPQESTVFLRGDEATAEAAVPHWSIEVDRIFRFTTPPAPVADPY